MTTWTCRDGRQVTIEDRDSMEDKHLLNTVAAVCEGRVRAGIPQARALVKELTARGLRPIEYSQELFVANPQDEPMLLLRMFCDGLLGRRSDPPQAFPRHAGFRRALRSTLVTGRSPSFLDERDLIIQIEPPKHPPPGPKRISYKRKVNV